MKKAIIAVLATVTLFTIGIFATFYAMPVLNPELVEQTQHRLDSLRMVKDGTYPDSLLALEEESPIDTSMLAKPLNTMLAGLRDSLNTLHASLDSEQETKEALVAKVQNMEERWAALQEKYDEAKQMSGTLAKLEDNELADLLESLDADVLESLYLEASVEESVFALIADDAGRKSRRASKRAHSIQHKRLHRRYNSRILGLPNQ